VLDSTFRTFHHRPSTFRLCRHQLPGILHIAAIFRNLLRIALISGSAHRTARAHSCCHPVGHGEVSPGKVLSFLAGKMPMRILSGKDGWMALGKFEPRIPDPSFSAWSAKGASQLTQTTRMRWNSGFPLYPKAIEELDNWINLLKFSHVFSYKRSLFCGITNFSMTDIGWTAALDPIQVAVGRRTGGSHWNSLGVHLGDSVGIEHKPLVIWWSNGVNTLPTMLVKGWVSLVWVIYVVIKQHLTILCAHHSLDLWSCGLGFLGSAHFSHFDLNVLEHIIHISLPMNIQPETKDLNLWYLFFLAID